MGTSRDLGLVLYPNLFGRFGKSISPKRLAAFGMNHTEDGHDFPFHDENDPVGEIALGISSGWDNGDAELDKGADWI